jgi:hypothetical protein
VTGGKNMSSVLLTLEDGDGVKRAAVGDVVMAGAADSLPPARSCEG